MSVSGSRFDEALLEEGFLFWIKGAKLILTMRTVIRVCLRLAGSALLLLAVLTLCVAPTIRQKEGLGDAILYTVVFSLLPAAVGALFFFETRAPHPPPEAPAREHWRTLCLSMLCFYRHPAAFGRSLFDALVREKPRAAPLARNLWFVYLFGGIVLFLLDRVMLEGIHEDGVFIQLLCLIGFSLSAAFLGLVHRWRDELQMGPSDWTCAVIFCFACVVPLAGFLPLINALGSPGEAIVYSGTVANRWKCESASGHSASSGQNLTHALFEMTSPYCVQIKDTASGAMITFEVGRGDYLRAETGRAFGRSIRRGRLGIPYRWSWESGD